MGRIIEGVITSIVVLLGAVAVVVGAAIAGIPTAAAIAILAAALLLLEFIGLGLAQAIVLWGAVVAVIAGLLKFGAALMDG